jgi:hypothetical protein
MAMTEQDVAEGVGLALGEQDWTEFTASDGDVAPKLVRTESFEERGLLTRDAGLVLRFEDGSEYQLTVVRSR